MTRDSERSNSNPFVRFANSARRPYDTDIDISSVDFWRQDFDRRDKAFAALRATAPVSWHPPLETPGLPAQHREAGFWAVTRAKDIVEVSRRHDVFSSEIGQVNVRPTPYRILDNMLVLDPPRQTAYRQIASRAFTPRATAAVEAKIEWRARRIVAQIRRRPAFDFVSDVAAQLPIRTIADLIGIPEAQQELFVSATDAYIRSRIPSRLPAGTTAANYIAARAADLRTLFLTIADARRAKPTDDLISHLVQARIEDRPLTDDELLSTIFLLIVAGDDTTKQLITLTMLALTRFHEERRWLQDDYDVRFDQAFDELVRYASPVISFARTARNDYVLAGRRISAGEKVALFYCSGNRDETLFPEPSQLRLAVARPKNVAFGGGGVHFCLGTSLARAQLRSIMRNLLFRLPSLRLGTPDYGFDESTRTIDALPAWPR